MQLDMGATDAALNRLGAALGLGPEAAAEGILALTNASLAAAVRLSLFEKGLHPRDFSLLSFGGAGGLHATEVADEMGMSEVIFPREPGTLSAYGIMFSDLVQDISRSRLFTLGSPALPGLTALIGELREEAEARLARDGVAPADRVLSVAADMRYLGQAFELLVPWGDVTTPDTTALASLEARFHDAHRQRFSYSSEGEVVEIVTLRVTATGRLPRPETTAPAPAERASVKGVRKVFANGIWHQAVIWDREALKPGDAIEGPAIIEEAFATHYIAAGWKAGLADAGAIIATRSL